METDSIGICDLTIFHGRNIYSHRPVMKMAVDIGKYDSIPTNKIPGFNEHLLQLFPGLKTNCCGLGYEGGFLERLNEGTFLGHVLEHVILEMQYMVGYDMHFGKTRQAGDSTVYNVIYEFENEVCGLECGKAAVFLLNCLLTGKDDDIDIIEFIDYLKSISREAELGPSTSAIVEEAKERGIPVTRIGSESLVRLGCGKFGRMLEATLTDITSCISADISSNKQLTKHLLSEASVPVPFGKVVYSELSAVMVAGQIGTPVVVKPFDGNQGKGVHLNLFEEEQIRASFKDAAKYSRGIIVEKQIPGKDYRVLVIGSRVRAVAERRPASVTGDGVHKVRELIDLVNLDPNRGEQHQKALTKIKMDAVTLSYLKKSGLSPDSVPAKGQLVLLRQNGNISTGGTACDCTDLIDPENADIAVRAAKAIGIDIAGIDIVTEDIAKPITETGGAVVEVNTAPGIRMHLYPSEGTPRNVAGDIVDWLFPTEESRHFPIVSVTGTNGKTTVVRLIQHVLALTGKKVGMTSTGGTYINEDCISKGDHSGPRSARWLLSSREIDAAVLETARGGIIREGLGYDLADVGVITNVTDDHLGIDGVDTLEDLAFVKSLVAEAVRSDGAVVLNADDPMTPYFFSRIHAKRIFFSKERKAGICDPAEDDTHVFVENGMITVENYNQTVPVLPVAEVPITCGGLFDCNVCNCLAAAAALYTLGVPAETIAAGLKSFSHNAGRFQLYRLRGFQVMLDYGHNLAGYEEVLKACRKITNGPLTGVIGMPGDRPDAAMQSVGRVCAQNFTKLYIKEDADLRGRNRREAAQIFYDSIQQTGFPEGSVQIIENEKDALSEAIAHAQEGELIVAFYEKLGPLEEYLNSIGAVREG